MVYASKTIPGINKRKVLCVELLAILVLKMRLQLF
jgi:hypothetical protein